MEKEIKITPPEGFEIDKENSTFECIRFKPVQKKRWRDNINAIFNGYFISTFSVIKNSEFNDNTLCNYNIFATEKQAKSALAMARISQIMANDERFGGVITDEEWKIWAPKYVTKKCYNDIKHDVSWYECYFLAFRTAEQRDLFFKENEDLVRDYLMLD